MTNKLKIVSLFSGIGGIDLGFENAGFETMLAIDNDPYACQVYRKNFPKVTCMEMPIEDSHDVRISSVVDVVVAGFPCQPYSVAGEGKGLSDIRGTVIYDMLKFIHRVKPRAIMFENVSFILRHDEGRTYKKIKELVNKIGYSLNAYDLNAKDYSGLPINRSRAYMVGYLDNPVKKRVKFQRLPNKKLTEMVISVADEKRALYGNEEYKKLYYLYDEKTGKGNKAISKKVNNAVSEVMSFYRYRAFKDGDLFRKAKKGVLFTPCTTWGTGGNNVPIFKRHKSLPPRKLTAREVANFMGFPDWFKLADSQSRSMILLGNSVVVPVVEQVAKHIKQHLTNER